MSRVTERPYLSIGEVLGLLLEEFSDVTISKIRFLESQGLIEPERTASGYRKFYDGDVERLRVILREQRQNFLPLRVIRDRLESGAIDSDATEPVVFDVAPPPPAAGAEVTVEPAQRPGPIAPRGIRNVPATAAVESPTAQISTVNHPAALHRPTAAPAPTPAANANGRAEVSDQPTPTPAPARPVADGAPLSRRDLCSQAGITDDELVQLESYGVLAGKGGAQSRYSTGDVAIAHAAAGFLKHGIDARHLRAWRTSAEREAGLFEQRILPLLRQRNPRARQEATETLAELAELGAALRAAIVAEVLRPHQS